MKILISPRKKLLAHLDKVKAVVKLRAAHDRKNAALLESELRSQAKRHQLIGRARVFTFALLYASVVSTLLSGTPVLGEVAQTIAAIAGVVGFGILSVIAIMLTWRLNQLWSLLLINYSHLIALYEKNNTASYALADLARDDE